jgi:hypothetical protein
MKTILYIISFFTIFQISGDIEEIKKTVKQIENNSKNISPEFHKDINLYKDINPDKFLHQTEWLYNPAIINMTKYKIENSTKINLEIQGFVTDLFSSYYFIDSSLIYVDFTRIDYKNAKLHDEFDSTEYEETKLEIALKAKKIIWSTDSTLNKIQPEKMKQIIEDAKTLIEFKK